MQLLTLSHKLQQDLKEIKHKIGELNVQIQKNQVKQAKLPENVSGPKPPDKSRNEELAEIQRQINELMEKIRNPEQWGKDEALVFEEVKKLGIAGRSVLEQSDEYKIKVDYANELIFKFANWLYPQSNICKLTQFVKASKLVNRL